MGTPIYLGSTLWSMSVGDLLQAFSERFVLTERTPPTTSIKYVPGTIVNNFFGSYQADANGNLIPYYPPGTQPPPPAPVITSAPPEDPRLPNGLLKAVSAADLNNMDPSTRANYIEIDMDPQGRPSTTGNGQNAQRLLSLTQTMPNYKFPAPNYAKIWPGM